MQTIASKSYNCGDVVFECRPVIYCLETEFKSFHCDYCLNRSSSLKKCSVCLQMWYCDRDCQQNDWKYHKYECKLYSSATFNINNTEIYFRLFVRIWFYVNSNPKFLTKKYRLMNGKSICLKDVDRGPARSLNGVSMAIFKDIAKTESFNLDSNQCRQMKVFIDLISCGRYLYTLKHYDESAIEAGVFPCIYDLAVGILIQRTYMDHSCLPNTDVVSEGLKVQIRAIKPIESGEPITTTFIALAQNKKVRHKDLADMYLPICECIKCKNDLDIDLDYDEIYELEVKEHRHWNTVGDRSVSTEFDKSYSINWHLIMYLRAIYGGDNTCLSEVMVHSFICYCLRRQTPTKSLIKLWYKQIEPSVLMTHGSEHIFYKIFRRLYLETISD